MGEAPGRESPDAVKNRRWRQDAAGQAIIRRGAFSRALGTILQIPI
jgi:hypothetical protein